MFWFPPRSEYRQGRQTPQYDCRSNGCPDAMSLSHKKVIHRPEHRQTRRADKKVNPSLLFYRLPIRSERLPASVPSHPLIPAWYCPKSSARFAPVRYSRCPLPQTPTAHIFSEKLRRLIHLRQSHAASHSRQGRCWQCRCPGDTNSCR